MVKDYSVKKKALNVSCLNFLADIKTVTRHLLQSYEMNIRCAPFSRDHQDQIFIITIVFFYINLTFKHLLL